MAVCLKCLGVKERPEMSSHFICKSCVDDGSPEAVDKFTRRQLVAALRNIGSQEEMQDELVSEYECSLMSQ